MQPDVIPVMDCTCIQAALMSHLITAALCGSRLDKQWNLHTGTLGVTPLKHIHALTQCLYLWNSGRLMRQDIPKVYVSDNWTYFHVKRRRQSSAGDTEWEILTSTIIINSSSWLPNESVLFTALMEQSQWLRDWAAAAVMVHSHCLDYRFH